MVLTESEGFTVSITTLYYALGSIILGGQNNAKILPEKRLRSQANRFLFPLLTKMQSLKTR